MDPWLAVLLLVLAAYRLTRLITKDDFPPVLWMRDRLSGGWRPPTDAEWAQVRALPLLQSRPWPVQDIDGVTHRYVHRWSWVPGWLADLVSCPWCASAYVSGALVLLYDLSVPGGLPVPYLYGITVWAGASLLASREWA